MTQFCSWHYAQPLASLSFLTLAEPPGTEELLMQDVAIKQLIKPGNLHLRMFEKVRYRLHRAMCSFQGVMQASVLHISNAAGGRTAPTSEL